MSLYQGFCDLMLPETLCSLSRAVWAEAAPPHTRPKRISERASAFKPDAVGLRAIYGLSKTTEIVNRARTASTLYGSALSVEWSLFHHHLEFEITFGGLIHERMLEELGECVLKYPFLHVGHLELLLGAGVIVETHHHIPQVGLVYDVNARFWASEHWRISAEFDYVRLNNDTESFEGITELLYRF